MIIEEFNARRMADLGLDGMTPITPFSIRQRL